jgi:hypothetical protein
MTAEGIGKFLFVKIINSLADIQIVPFCLDLSLSDWLIHNQYSPVNFRTLISFGLKYLVETRCLIYALSRPH